MIWAFILRLWGGLGRIARIAAAYPWQAALIASLIACGWLWTGKRKAQDRADDYRAQIQKERAAYVAAQEQARIRAEMALRAQEARYKEKADNADKAHAKALVDASRAADRYIVANRVRIEAAPSDASQAPARAESGSAGLPAKLPADPFVAVSRADLQACTAAVTYAVAAHNWAQTLPREDERAPQLNMEP